MTVSIWPHEHLDDKGRCCGRKPIVYKRRSLKFCPRCDRAYHILSGLQIGNWAWREVDGGFVLKMPTSLIPVGHPARNRAPA